MYFKIYLMLFNTKISMSAAQTMEGVSTRVSTLLVLTSVSVEVDTHSPAMEEIAKVYPPKSFV